MLPSKIWMNLFPILSGLELIYCHSESQHIEDIFAYHCKIKKKRKYTNMNQHGKVCMVPFNKTKYNLQIWIFFAQINWHNFSQSQVSLTLICFFSKFQHHLKNQNNCSMNGKSTVSRKLCSYLCFRAENCSKQFEIIQWASNI